MNEFFVTVLAIIVLLLGVFSFFSLIKEQRKKSALQSVLQMISGDNNTVPSFEIVDNSTSYQQKISKYLLSKRAYLSLTITFLTIVVGWQFFPNLIFLWILASSLSCLLALLVLFLIWTGKRELLAMSEQFPEALDLVSRAAKVGISPDAVLGEIVGSFPDPISKIFQEINGLRDAGLPMDLSCERVYQKYPIKELLYLQAILSIQRKVGGSYSHLIEMLAKNMRERKQKDKRINVATSEARTAAKVVSLLALGSIFSLFFLNKDQFLFLLNDPSGHSILIYCAVSILIGFTSIRQLLRTVK